MVKNKNKQKRSSNFICNYVKRGETGSQEYLKLRKTYIHDNAYKFQV